MYIFIRMILFKIYIYITNYVSYNGIERLKSYVYIIYIFDMPYILQCMYVELLCLFACLFACLFVCLFVFVVLQVVWHMSV